MSEKLDSAFIICPIGDQFSTTRRDSDGLNTAVLKPILSEYFKNVHAPLDLARPGSITSQVIILLATVDLVVANLTELNPNVMYELAVRHAARKPIILVAEIGTKLPFDLVDERTIFYSNDMAGVEAAKLELRNAIDQVLLNPDQDNPIYRALQRKLISELTNSDDATSFILKKLEEFENVLLNSSSQNRSNLETDIIFNKTVNDYMLIFSKDDGISKDVAYDIMSVVSKAGGKLLPIGNGYHILKNKELTIRAKLTLNSIKEIESTLRNMEINISVVQTEYHNYYS